MGVGRRFATALRKGAAVNPLTTKHFGKSIVTALSRARRVLDRTLVTRLSLKLLAPEGRSDEILAALRSLARHARQEWGCESFDVYACVENPSRILMQVDWSDPRAMAAYVRSDDFTNVLTIVELAPGPPVFEFRIGDEVRGLDYLAEIRGIEPA